MSCRSRPRAFLLWMTMTGSCSFGLRVAVEVGQLGSEANPELRGTIRHSAYGHDGAVGHPHAARAAVVDDPDRVARVIGILHEQDGTWPSAQACSYEPARSAKGLLVRGEVTSNPTSTTRAYWGHVEDWPWAAGASCQAASSMSTPPTAHELSVGQRARLIRSHTAQSLAQSSADPG